MLSASLTVRPVTPSAVSRTELALTCAVPTHLTLRRQERNGAAMEATSRRCRTSQRTRPRLPDISHGAGAAWSWHAVRNASGRRSCPHRKPPAHRVMHKVVPLAPHRPFVVWFIYEFHCCDSSRHMTEFQPAANAVAGLMLVCPRCDAQPGELCTNPRGERRQTTHRERKKEAEQDGG